MARFTVRVELHYATDDDYETLHEAMENRGFSRAIALTDGTRLHLPTAEYNLERNITKEAVLALAKAAASTTRKRYAVLVTESAGRTWFGLDKVE